MADPERDLTDYVVFAYKDPIQLWSAFVENQTLSSVPRHNDMNQSVRPPRFATWGKAQIRSFARSHMTADVTHEYRSTVPVEAGDFTSHLEGVKDDVPSTEGIICDVARCNDPIAAQRQLTGVHYLEQVRTLIAFRYVFGNDV